jgi:hypothetical protein
MLCNIFCALQDAGRRLIWITPCKPQAQLGVETASSLPELRSSSTHDGVVETWHAASLPRAALRLHGVIQIRRLPASCNAQKVLRNISYTLHKTILRAV